MGNHQCFAFELLITEVKLCEYLLHIFYITALLKLTTYPGDDVSKHEQNTAFAYPV